MDSGAERDAKPLIDRFLLLTGRQQTMKFLAPDVQGKNDGNYCGVFMLHCVVSILEALKRENLDKDIIDEKISKTR